ncbi:hypothetical protein [Nocardiopsis sp. FIRDI 009]|uniref:hypothetical protein n=1 Tax=Nocardiopsis sp. FIRDI 009 TaxID=714197 RepID=UPI000E241113|nr:hypothetical protein [Nocardiopsis sp. FIRDI 009]
MTQRTVTSDVHVSSRPAKVPQPRFHKPNEDLAAAMECARCAELGISTPPGWANRRKPSTKKERKRKQLEHIRRQREAPKKPHKPGPLPLNELQSAFLREVWAYLTRKAVGDDPDSRLLALTCALRGAIKGYANMTGQDVRSLRMEDAHAALTTLISSGWLDTTPERAINAEPSNIARCGLPDLQGNPWDVGNGVRSRASGWVTRSLTHKKMRKKPNRLRLVAAYLPAQADSDGHIRLPVDEVVAACALTGGPDEVTELAEWLLRLDWIQDLRVADGTLHARLTELTMPMAPRPFPPPTPPRAAPATTPAEVPVPDRARNLLAGREAQVARWVADYRDEHGHGPSWAMVSDEFGWPPRQAPDQEVTREIFRLLEEGGWLTGLGVPFGLRPGPAHGDANP